MTEQEMITGLPWWLSGQELGSLGQEDALEKEMATHFGVPAGKSYGQRSLVGYSPQSRK